MFPCMIGTSSKNNQPVLQKSYNSCHSKNSFYSSSYCASPLYCTASYRSSNLPFARREKKKRIANLYASVHLQHNFLRHLLVPGGHFFAFRAKSRIFTHFLPFCLFPSGVKNFPRLRNTDSISSSQQDLARIQNGQEMKMILFEMFHGHRAVPQGWFNQ